jgi:hypothetical protein
MKKITSDKLRVTSDSRDNRDIFKSLNFKSLNFKLLTLLSAFCFLPFAIFAQTNDIVVYTEKGEPFTLYVNSVKQNDPPEANVRARNITGDSYTIRVQFADQTIEELTKKYWTEAKNVDITLIVKQNNKGKWVINTHGETPRAYEQPVVVHHHVVTPPPQEYYETGTVSMHVNDGGEHVNVNMNVSGGSINVSASDGYESANINMSVNTGVNVSANVTTTGYVETHHGGHVPPPAPRCQYATSHYDFTQALNTIQKETFEKTKITLTKQVCQSSCMTAEQLRVVLKAFTFEASRLEIAKFAYDYVFDPEKFYLINDAFEFSSSVDELNRFLNPR